MDNLIINIGGEKWQYKQLQDRLVDKNENTVVISLKSSDISRNPTSEELKLFNKIDSNCRIYIIDHGRPNSANISGCHYSELGDYLAKRIPEKNIVDQKKHLKISIISCSGGEGGDKSFGGLFHRYLGQRHHINTEVVARNEIVMINSNTARIGKTTDSWLRSGINTGIKSVVKDFKGLADEETLHQRPGSKSKFKWDANGNEVMVDAYMDKFAEIAKKAKDEIFKSTLTISNPKDRDKVNELLNDIMIDCNKTEEMDGKTTERVIKNFKEVFGLLKKNSCDSEEVKSLIVKLIKLKGKSIDDNSVKSKVFDHNISKESDDVFSPMVYMKKIFNKNVVPEARNLSKNHPDSQMKKSLMDSLGNLYNFIGEVGSQNLKLGQNVEVEHTLVKFMEDMLKTANSTELTKEEKIFQINLLKSNILSFIHNETFISPYIQGAIDGIKISLDFGGFAGLKALTTVPNSFGEFRQFQVEGESTLINEFSKNLLNYLAEINYNGYEVKSVEEQISEDATKILNVKTFQIDENINLSQAALTENLNKKDSSSNVKLTDQFAKNKKTIEDINKFELQMRQYVDDERRCPDKNIRNIYVSRVFPMLNLKIKELESINSRLETEINSRNINKVDVDELD